MSVQQDEPLTHPQFRYVIPGFLIAGLGMLFSVGMGTYVGMQAFLVYSFPYVLLATVGFFAYYIKKFKLLAILFAVSAAALSGTVIAVTLQSLDGRGNLIQQLDTANITAFTVGLVVAVLLSLLLAVAAKLIRPRPKKLRQDDFLPF